MTDPSQQPVPATQPEADEISLINLLIVLAKHKRLIAGVTLGAALIAAIISLLMSNIYTATAKILPPQQDQSSAVTLLGQMGSLGGLGGSALGIKNPNDLYVGMLKSRSVADTLIKRFNLNKVYDIDAGTGARAKLAKASQISSGKDSLITISVDDKDPKRAAAIANAYVDELAKLNQTLAVTEAARRRLFFENQLKQAKDELANAEVALKNTQQQSGLIQLDAQGRAIIDAVAKLRGEIVAKEVQLGAMRTFATTRNAEYVRTQQELAGLKEQLGKMESNTDSDIPGDGNVLVTTGKVPESGMEYVRKVRDVKYYETIYELIAKQYQLAKIDEAKDTSIVQVLDMAIEPENKSEPNRVLMVLFGALAGFFIAVLWVIVREAVGMIMNDPEHMERMALFRRVLRE